MCGVCGTTLLCLSFYLHFRARHSCSIGHIKRYVITALLTCDMGLYVPTVRVQCYVRTLEEVTKLCCVCNPIKEHTSPGPEIQQAGIYGDSRRYLPNRAGRDPPPRGNKTTRTPSPGPRTTLYPAGDHLCFNRTQIIAWGRKWKGTFQGLRCIVTINRP